jgi:hypothetical protein
MQHDGAGFEQEETETIEMNLWFLSSLLLEHPGDYTFRLHSYRLAVEVQRGRGQTGSKLNDSSTAYLTPNNSPTTYPSRMKAALKPQIPGGGLALVS